MSKVSIIIPIFNAAPYLKQCLDSLLAQTEKNWEAILVENGSADQSRSIAQEYAGKDHRFALLILDENKGQSVARNLGLNMAKGEYVAFLDADDWWETDYLEQHLSAIPGYDIVQSGYKRCTMHNAQCTVLEEKTPWHKWQFTSACMRLYRREAIAGLRFEEGTYYEDVLWTVDVLQRNPNIKKLNYIGYYYRLNPQSTTSTPHSECREKVLQILKNKKLSGITIYTQLKLRLFWLLGN